jgi:hypothetical protein
VAGDFDSVAEELGLDSALSDFDEVSAFSVFAAVSALSALAGVVEPESPFEDSLFAEAASDPLEDFEVERLSVL